MQGSIADLARRRQKLESFPGDKQEDVQERAEGDSVPSQTLNFITLNLILRCRGTGSFREANSETTILADTVSPKVSKGELSEKEVSRREGQEKPGSSVGNRRISEDGGDSERSCQEAGGRALGSFKITPPKFRI